MTISSFSLSPIDNSRVADNGIAINSIAVTDNIIELDVVAIITIVSNDFSFVVNILRFFNFFFDL